MSRILVVEDNAANRLLVRDILRHRGHEIFEAASVEEGRAWLQRQALDLVLLDVRIPGGGGEQLLREIRSDPRFTAVPVVAVTAQAMRGDRERLLAAGFDGYVSKPIDTRGFGPEIESFVKSAT
jgi:two-component system cell cycle response regulator DivK